MQEIFLLIFKGEHLRIQTMAMAQPPLLRLTDEEVAYLKKQFYHQVKHDKHLLRAFDGPNNKHISDWVLNKVLMTADHFKIRYSKED